MLEKWKRLLTASLAEDDQSELSVHLSTLAHPFSALIHSAPLTRCAWRQRCLRFGALGGSDDSTSARLAASMPPLRCAWQHRCLHFGADAFCRKFEFLYAETQRILRCAVKTRVSVRRNSKNGAWGGDERECRGAPARSGGGRARVPRGVNAREGGVATAWDSGAAGAWATQGEGCFVWSYLAEGAPRVAHPLEDSYNCQRLCMLFLACGDVRVRLRMGHRFPQNSRNA